MASSRHKGRRCVVAGCSNTAGNGVSAHTFPADTKTFNAWKSFVRLTRADWEEPTKHSAICSEHFNPTCFDAQYEIKAKLGFSTKRRLNPGSVPSIYPKRDRDDLNEAFLSSPVTIGIQCDLLSNEPSKDVETPSTPRKPEPPSSEQPPDDMDITPSDTSSSSDGDMSLYEPSSSDTSSNSDVTMHMFTMDQLERGNSLLVNPT
ncbi:THAP domain-containing protein 1-like [Pecten maximus]|uniref:THAP domain-containing protein 1-like n=1 Tax=Pecten maximus TaxID=6579 RepID=UPI0014586398|nr:THAP domain-containing protein 1-like [Pecten maximus]